MNNNNIPPSTELFLLLPEHKRIIQGKSRRIGVPKEAASLQRAMVILGILLMTYLVLGTVLPGSIDSLVDLILFLVPNVVIATFLFLVYRRYKCLAKLEEIGILLSGRVVAVNGDKAITSEGLKPVLRLRYEFTSPQGRRFEREEAQGQEIPEELPAAGTAVAIIYASDDCFRVL